MFQSTVTKIFSSAALLGLVLLAGCPDNKPASNAPAQPPIASATPAAPAAPSAAPAAAAAPTAPAGQAKPAAFIDSMGSTATVVYVCDGSDAMQPRIQTLKQELKNSISELDSASGQKFNVVFFFAGVSMPAFKDAAQLATPDNKKLALQFVDDFTCSGGSDPQLAIQFALAEKPQLLYLLSGGFTKDGDAAIAAFQQGNPDGKTHVNAIYFPTHADPKLEEVMKKIATDGHGQFKELPMADVKN